MNRLLSYLESYNPAFQYAQISTGGSWETAVRVDSDEAHDELVRLTKTDDESVAGELMYRLSDGRIAFLGIRYSSTFVKVSSPGGFVMEFARAARKAHDRKFETVMADVSQRLTGSETTLAESELNFAELGVIDNWHSMGSVVLPSESTNATNANLQAILSQNKSLVANSKNHVGVELAFMDPAYWVGIQVSDTTGDQYVTNLDAIKQVLATVM